MGLCLGRKGGKPRSRLPRPLASRALEEINELAGNPRRDAWATLQWLRKFLEEHGTRVAKPDERTFESEGEVIETGMRKTVESRDTVVKSLARAAYRSRDAALIAEKKKDFGPALQNLYKELEGAEDFVGQSARCHTDFTGVKSRYAE